MDVRFGTDGLRGRAGASPIRVQEAVAVGRAAARWAREQGSDRVLVGHDPRPSSGGLEAGVVAGISAAGVRAVRLGCVPTPVVGVALAADLAPVGVMVTASHNPAPDNGFKVIGPGGRKPLDAEVARIEAWMAEAVTDGPLGAVVDGADEALAAWDAAVQRLDLGLPARPLVVDLAHGAAVRMRSRLEALWPGDLYVVGDGAGVVNDGVGSEHLDHLGEAVRRHGAWAGLAVDGDGDRCRLVDGQGRAVHGDAVTWLLATALGVDALAVTVMSTTALEAQLPGVDVVRTAVGDKHLMAAMVARDLPLGAEESGHVLFGDFPAGDGLVAGLRALAAVGERTVEEALAGFAPFPRRLGKVRVASRPPIDAVAPVQAAVAAAEAELGPQGRVFLRYSGTEPVLRVLVEGPVAEQVDAAYASVRSVIEEVMA